MTVVTTVFFGSVPCLSMRSAQSAMTASPSTTWPRSSTMITRSASPSRAMPMAAPLRTTSRAVLGVERAAVVVDVLAVGLDAERDHVGAELAEDQRRDHVGGAVPASTTILMPSSESRLGNVFLQKTT